MKCLIGWCLCGGGWGWVEIRKVWVEAGRTNNEFSVFFHISFGMMIVCCRLFCCLFCVLYILKTTTTSNENVSKLGIKPKIKRKKIIKNQTVTSTNGVRKKILFFFWKKILKSTKNKKFLNKVCLPRIFFTCLCVCFNRSLQPNFVCLFVVDDE